MVLESTKDVEAQQASEQSQPASPPAEEQQKLIEKESRSQEEIID